MFFEVFFGISKGVFAATLGKPRRGRWKVEASKSKDHGERRPARVAAKTPLEIPKSTSKNTKIGQRVPT